MGLFRKMGEMIVPPTNKPVDASKEPVRPKLPGSPYREPGIQSERKDYVTLLNVPTFSEFPSDNVLKKVYKIDWFWNVEYRAGRPMKDFDLTKDDLRKIGMNEAQSTAFPQIHSRKKRIPARGEAF